MNNIDLIINKMLPEIAKKKFADFTDVFYETIYFTTEKTQQIMEVGIKFGLKPKIHVYQFNSIGGIKAGVKYSAHAFNHLEIMKPEVIKALKNTKTILVALLF